MWKHVVKWLHRLIWWGTLLVLVWNVAAPEWWTWLHGDQVSILLWAFGIVSVFHFAFAVKQALELEKLKAEEKEG